MHLLCTLAAILACIPGEAGPPSPQIPQGLEEFLVREGDIYRLKDRVSLRIERWGFNLNGEMTVIEPSGRWTVARFGRGPSGQEQCEVRRSGQLSQEQLVDLARTMASERVKDWPRMIGEEPKVNPQRYIVRDGPRQTVLAGLSTFPGKPVAPAILRASNSPPKGSVEQWRRFALVVEAIESQTRQVR